MYEWLENELAAVKTRRFHLVDGPADPKLKDAVLQSELPLPPSYREFVLRFGNAKLYRTDRTGYFIGVFAGPREETREDGTRIYRIGFDDDARIYVVPEPGAGAFPIYEREWKSIAKVADDFEEWLTDSCDWARNSYGTEKWEEILRGPEPFSLEEKEILEARRRISWRVTGIDSDGNHNIEVSNAGIRALPALTVAARSKDGGLNADLRLDIGHIGPGQSAVLLCSTYKELMSPHEIELLALPDPEPEERDYYYEFSAL